MLQTKIRIVISDGWSIVVVAFYFLFRKKIYSIEKFKFIL